MGVAQITRGRDRNNPASTCFYSLFLNSSICRANAAVGSAPKAHPAFKAPLCIESWGPNRESPQAQFEHIIESAEGIPWWIGERAADSSGFDPSLTSSRRWVNARETSTFDAETCRPPVGGAPAVPDSAGSFRE
jgi:hypothetical protein